MTSKVYILDDDAQYAMLLQGICHAEGIAVDIAYSPGRFIATLPETGILILNLNGPSCSGIDVIQALGSSSSKLKLIIMSSYDAGILHSGKCLALENGVPVLACFNKPVMVPPLIQAIKRGMPTDQVRLQLDNKRHLVPEHNQLIPMC